MQLLRNDLIIRLLEIGETPPFDLLLMADPRPEMVDECIGRGACYVAEMNGSIVGTCVLLPTRPATMELANIAVAEAMQGQGLGKRLVQYAIDEARQAGARTLVVGTGNSSLPALALYQKCGFRIVGIDRDFFPRHGYGDIIENGIRCRDMLRLSLDL
jgi:ribosomal protein S18 acetylase RimI-like enzyme